MKFGWITPTGRFVECDLHKHLEVASQDPEMSLCIKELLDHLESVREGCQELEDREGRWNAEWHCYEMAMDDAQESSIEILYESNFIRVGEFNDTFHFEGTSHAIKYLYQYCLDFAEGYGKSCQFFPRKTRKNSA